AEIERVLGAQDATFFAAQYDVTAEGNFEGHNILNRLKQLPRGTAGGGVAPEQAARLAMLHGKLLNEREKRIRPGLDDKVLGDRQRLMIAALANAGSLLDEPDWIAIAARAFSFIAAAMTRGDRRPASRGGRRGVAPRGG